MFRWNSRLARIGLVSRNTLNRYHTLYPRRDSAELLNCFRPISNRSSRYFSASANGGSGDKKDVTAKEVQKQLKELLEADKQFTQLEGIAETMGQGHTDRKAYDQANEQLLNKKTANKDDTPTSIKDLIDLSLIKDDTEFLNRIHLESQRQTLKDKLLRKEDPEFAVLDYHLPLDKEDVVSLPMDPMYRRVKLRGLKVAEQFGIEDKNLRIDTPYGMNFLELLGILDLQAENYTKSIFGNDPTFQSMMVQKTRHELDQMEKLKAQEDEYAMISGFKPPKSAFEAEQEVKQLGVGMKKAYLENTLESRLPNETLHKAEEKYYDKLMKDDDKDYFHSLDELAAQEQNILRTEAIKKHKELIDELVIQEKKLEDTRPFDPKSLETLAKNMPDQFVKQASLLFIPEGMPLAKEEHIDMELVDSDNASTLLGSKVFENEEVEKAFDKAVEQKVDLDKPGFERWYNRHGKEMMSAITGDQLKPYSGGTYIEDLEKMFPYLYKRVKEGGNIQGLDPDIVNLMKSKITPVHTIKEYFEQTQTDLDRKIKQEEELTQAASEESYERQGKLIGAMAHEQVVKPLKQELENMPPEEQERALEEIQTEIPKSIFMGKPEASTSHSVNVPPELISPARPAPEDYLLSFMRKRMASNDESFNKILSRKFDSASKILAKYKMTNKPEEYESQISAKNDLKRFVDEIIYMIRYGAERIDKLLDSTLDEEENENKAYDNYLNSDPHLKSYAKEKFEKPKKDDEKYLDSDDPYVTSIEEMKKFRANMEWLKEMRDDIEELNSASKQSSGEQEVDEHDTVIDKFLQSVQTKANNEDIDQLLKKAEESAQTRGKGWTPEAEEQLRNYMEEKSPVVKQEKSDKTAADSASKITPEFKKLVNQYSLSNPVDYHKTQDIKREIAKEYRKMKKEQQKKLGAQAVAAKSDEEKNARKKQVQEYWDLFEKDNEKALQDGTLFGLDKDADLDTLLDRYQREAEEDYKKQQNNLDLASFLAEEHEKDDDFGLGEEKEEKRESHSNIEENTARTSKETEKFDDKSMKDEIVDFKLERHYDTFIHKWLNEDFEDQIFMPAVEQTTNDEGIPTTELLTPGQRMLDKQANLNAATIIYNREDRDEGRMPDDDIQQRAFSISHNDFFEKILPPELRPTPFKEEDDLIPKPEKRTIEPAFIEAINIPLLSRYMNASGWILSRSETGLSTKNQRRVSKAIKRAHHMGLISFKNRYFHMIDPFSPAPEPFGLKNPFYLNQARTWARKHKRRGSFIDDLDVAAFVEREKSRANVMTRTVKEPVDE